jgi:hypothetical protein
VRRRAVLTVPVAVSMAGVTMLMPVGMAAAVSVSVLVSMRLTKVGEAAATGDRRVAAAVQLAAKVSEFSVFVGDHRAFLLKVVPFPERSVRLTWRRTRVSRARRHA